MQHAEKSSQPARHAEPVRTRKVGAETSAAAFDQSPRDMQLRAIAQMMRESPQTKSLETLSARMAAHGQPAAQRMAPEEEPLQGRFDTVQRQGAEEDELQLMAAPEEEEPLQGRFETAQRQGAEDEELQMKAAPATPLQRQAEASPPPNRTGLPDGLKAGIEQLSGMAMDHVKVHYNSSQPAQMNALAYAQGSDIHIGPGQEQHLPHEAWHVVQQAQGRVRPTMQMKDGVPVNDDAGLEREADVMGETATAKGAAIVAEGEETGSLPIFSTENTVVQRRLPVMTKETITSEPKVAAELLVHSLQQLDDDKLTNYFQEDLDNSKKSRASWITYLQSDPEPNEIQKLYTSMIDQPAIAKYSMEHFDPSEPATEIKKQIQQHMDSVSHDLDRTINNTDVLKSIMGVNDVGLAVKVLTLAKNAIDQHIVKKTCPVVIGGNKEHNLWTGVGGMTKQGDSQMELGQSTANALANGSASGRASLVHEFTHATAGTKDHAYTVEACYSLLPDKRLDNATTYEHAFLETVSAADKKRHYNPKHEQQTSQGNDLLPVNAARLRAARRAAQLASEVWNNVDNAYLQAQKIAIGEKITEINMGLSALATYPYTPMKTPATYNFGLALIEDRTKMLVRLKTASGHKKIVRYYSTVDFNDDLTAADVLGKSIADTGIMLEHDAVKWVSWLENEKNIMNFLQEKKSTYT
jgi:Domain of unknown function (DUF4157)/Lysine-specific metallo-endopeptidase